MKGSRETMLKFRKILILLGIVFIIGLAWGGAQVPAEQIIFHSYSKPLALPEIALEDLDGKTVSIQEQQGKVILLNFWATW
jgi:cytochrome oxidase Cu insertion factor (SCO1/SenC/PrrC family)